MNYQTQHAMTAAAVRYMTVFNRPTGLSGLFRY